MNSLNNIEKEFKRIYDNLDIIKTNFSDININKLIVIIELIINGFEYDNNLKKITINEFYSVKNYLKNNDILN